MFYPHPTPFPRVTEGEQQPGVTLHAFEVIYFIAPVH